MAYRPAEWRGIGSDSPVHPAQLGYAVHDFLAGSADSVFVSDGGEIGQWAQACVNAPHRIINGPAGAIGSALPFALAARTLFPQARIAATLGDGTFGFHPLEIDTAVRHDLPFVAVIGNDARWNAEVQIQHRTYGADRAVGCDLRASRYDEVARALDATAPRSNRPPRFPRHWRQPTRPAPPRASTSACSRSRPRQSPG